MENSEQIEFNGELVVLVDGMPTFSPMAKMIDSFKTLIQRDKGGKVKGDYDGRKKLMSTMELAYVWFMSDRKSPIKNNYKPYERHRETIKKLNMPEEWKPDEKVEEAIEVWSEMTETQTSKVLEEMKESLFSSQRIISLIRKKLDTKLDTIELLDDVSELVDMETGVDQIAIIMKDMKSLLDMAKNIPDVISTVERLEEKVSKEKSDGKGKGGKTINKFQFRKGKR